MKKIIVLSDTHGNQLLLRKALQNEKDAAVIFHLGDYYEDLDENFDLTENKTIVKVPGIFHIGYLNKTIPATQTFAMDSWNFLLVHNLDDVHRKLIKPDLTLFGHTHNRTFYKKGNVFYLNPGHLKNTEDKGRKPSYSILEVTTDFIAVGFKNEDGKIIATKTIKR